MHIELFLPISPVPASFSPVEIQTQPAGWVGFGHFQPVPALILGVGVHVRKETEHSYLRDASSLKILAELSGYK